MNLLDPKKLITIHGPCFSGSGEIVERKVTARDVPDYRRAGYELGPIPEEVNLKKRIAELEAALAEKAEKPKGKIK